MGPFLNYVNLIDCSFSTTNENYVILGRFYVGPILPLVQWPPQHVDHKNNDYCWSSVFKKSPYPKIKSGLVLSYIRLQIFATPLLADRQTASIITRPIS